MQKIKLGSKLKKIFTSSVNSCLGIFIEDEAIYIAKVDNVEQGAELSYLETIRLDSTDDVKSDIMAEKISMLCLQNNLQVENVALCLSQENYWYERNDMPEMSDKELRGNIKYQVEVDGPYANDEYWYDYLRLNEHTLIVGTISVSDGKELVGHFANNGFKLGCLAITNALPKLQQEENVIMLPTGYLSLAANIPPKIFSTGELNVIATAWSGLHGRNVFNILPQQFRLENIAWQRLSVYLVIIVSILMLLSGGYNWWKIKQSEAELAELQHKLTFTTKQTEYMKHLQQQYCAINKKEELLGRLSKERISIYALMIHLGTMTQDGVTLTEVKYEGKGNFICQGKTQTYNELVNYLAEIKKRKNYFQGSAKVVDTKLGEDGMIKFTLQLKTNSNE